MSQPDRYIVLGSKYDRLSNFVRMEVDSNWVEEYDQTRRCLGYWDDISQCGRERSDLQLSPPPLEPLVTGKELGFCSGLFTPVVTIMRDDAKAVFSPYLQGAVWGRIYELRNGEKRPTQYSTLLMPKALEVDSYRGRVIVAPKICKFCGQAFTWAASCKEEGLLRWQIRDRPVVFGNAVSLCVSPEYFKDMKLRSLFPDLKVVHKIKIYDKDPWGFVLPGDPEWDGTFRLPPAWLNRKQPVIAPDEPELDDETS